MKSLFRSVARSGVLSIFAGLSLCASPSSAGAATILGVYANDVGNTSYNISSLGTSDWAYWDKSSTNLAVAGTATNEMAGSSLIGSVYATGGLGLRGTTNSNKPTYDFTYTNGVSPVSGTATDPIGIFNQTLDTTGVGVGLDIILPSTSTFTVSLWVSGYGGTGTLTATLPGATTYTDSSFTIGATRIGSLYTLTVTPNAANDVLSLNFTLVDNAGISSSHTMIGAAALSSVPEPSTWVLVATGFLVLGFAGRRRLCTVRKA